MSYELIYYPKCSTCVKGLELLNANGITPKLITYMTDRLDVAKVTELAKKVGSAKTLIREKTAREIGLSLDLKDDKLIAAIVENPNLLQRPILIKGDKAIIGRPIEEMLKCQ